jgi:hypothetical protein
VAPVRNFRGDGFEYCAIFLRQQFWFSLPPADDVRSFAGREQLPVGIAE